jgi:hypothetical protein
MTNKFYDDFGITKNDKKWLEKQELNNLFKRVSKRSKVNTPHYNQTFSPNVTHQADLLTLPVDNDYGFALVVTDIATRISDAEPLKGKSAQEVKDGLESIYERDILEKPIFMVTDSGSEFKGVVQKYLDEHDISHKFTKPGRHTQTSIVERTNQYLAKAFFRRMHAQEILTGEKSVEWVDDLPLFIKALNKRRGRKPPSVPDTVPTTVCEGDACNLLSIGTKVRVMLEEPIDYVTKKKLSGNFRSTDIRWNPTPRYIRDILLLPGRPPLYLVSDIKNDNKVDNTVGYTKNQLQVMLGDEEPPDLKSLRGDPTGFVVENILDRKKENNRVYMLVKMKGRKEPAWKLRSEVNKQVPEMVTQFESEQ